MITKDKITEIFCSVDDFCKEFDKVHLNKNVIITYKKLNVYCQRNFIELGVGYSQQIFFIRHHSSFS